VNLDRVRGLKALRRSSSLSAPVSPEGQRPLVTITGSRARARRRSGMKQIGEDRFSEPPRRQISTASIFHFIAGAESLRNTPLISMH
jgi:hypothetical protein